MKKILFVRHGLTEANEKKLYYGSSDVPLSSRGIEALKEMRRSYELLYDLMSEQTGEPDLYSSGMIRTNSTLEILFPGKKYSIIEGLREMDFGAFEMHTYEELKDDPGYIAWIESDVEISRCPGGESPPDVVKRATDGLKPLLHSGKNCICVTHGGTIASLMMHYFPGEGHRGTFTPNTGSWLLVEYDETGKAVAYKMPDKTDS